MPKSTVLSLTEPERSEEHVRGGNVKEFITARGAYAAQLTRIDLHHLWMQRLRKSLPGVSHTAVIKGRAVIVFLADMDQQPMSNGGMTVRAGEIVAYREGSEHHLRTSAGYHCATMSLSPSDLAIHGRALVGRELSAPAATRVVRPSTASMARLLHLHKAASDLALNAPDILANPEVAKAIEQELVRAMVSCLTEGEAVGAAREGRRPIMQRFEQVLEAHEGELIYLTDLCAEMGVSDRILRLHCQEQLGMGPHQYLWLRRMNMARRALAHAGSAQSTVTTIATEHGFGELGRFSVQYRKLFGELPSETLRRAPDEPRPIAISPPEQLRFPVLP